MQLSDPSGWRRLDGVALLMGVSFAFIWSSAFTAAKILLLDAPPFALLTARFFLSGIIACGLALLFSERLPQGCRVWMAILVIGLCQNASISA